jgi:hypothetical protein
VISLRKKIGDVLINKAISLWMDERGSLDQLVWLIGSALVIALIVWGASTYAPTAVQNFFTTAVGWIQAKFQAVLGS